ncbi:MAG: LLM class flavin-dependent oxidoreductase [Chloroflexota bacterium]
MRFGVGLPTCTAGMMYPVPFATAHDIVRVAVEAEQLGYFEVAGNDHISTQRYVRETFPDPPDFFEPLIAYAYCAARTSVLRLVTGVIVLPMRQPVLLAKQLATLDQFSGGRVILGAGVGAYREELESAYPDLKDAPRAQLARESIRALRLLFTERRATFEGKHYRFHDLEMYPKPVQNPLPIYSAGNAEGSIKRAGELCEGWLPAGIGPERIREGKAKLEQYARAAGRDPSNMAIAPQLIVCLGKTKEEAREHFERSQLYHHLVSLQQSTLKGVDIDSYLDINLVGTPEDVCRKVSDLEAAGATHLCGLYFVGNSVEEMMAQVRDFATHVMDNFAS